jgi:hypothetical protein
MRAQVLQGEEAIRVILQHLTCIRFITGVGTIQKISKSEIFPDLDVFDPSHETSQFGRLLASAIPAFLLNSAEGSTSHAASQLRRPLSSP